MALDEAWVVAAGTAAGYLLLLVVGFVVLFVVPFVAFSLA